MGGPRWEQVIVFGEKSRQMQIWGGCEFGVGVYEFGVGLAQEDWNFWHGYF